MTVVLMYCFSDARNSASVPGFGADTNAEEEEPQALTFHGIILRSQLVTLLKKGVFYSENNQVIYSFYSVTMIPIELNCVG